MLLSSVEDTYVLEFCKAILTSWTSVDGILFLSSVDGYLYLGAL